MSKIRIAPNLAIALLALTCLVPPPARSTTFVLMDEQTLMQSSDVVATGTVTSITSATADLAGTIYTYITVQPERIIKGQIESDALVIREPGGSVGDRRQWTFGAPEFWVGERTLLFLTRSSDGTLQTTSLAMGKFTLAVDRNGDPTAVRDFGEGASVFVPDTGRIADAPPETQPLAPLLKRLRRLASSAGGTAQRQPLQVPPIDTAAAVTETHESYTFLGSPPSRWFEPDSNLPVNYLIDSTGDSQLGFATSRAALDAAFAAWTNIPTSSLTLADGGTTTPGAFGPCDANRITFNDPYNEVTDPVSCSGVLAIGGFCSGGGTRVVNGTTFSQIVVGKVTFNNGWSACSFWNQCNMSEVATHELGHTIGLGHSADGTATMAASAHFDGRCAGLRADDIAAANFIYPQTGSPTPTSTPGIAPTSTSGAAATPTRTPTSPSGTANDACANAITVDSIPYLDTTATTGATTDANDPTVGCGNGSRAKSTFYSFTAPSNGTVTANTFGSNYDTILAAYTGTCGAFTAVPGACNDDSSGAQSLVSFTASAGTVYYFLVSAYSSNGGSLAFQLTFQGAAPTATLTPSFTPLPPTPTRTQTPSPTFTFTLGPPTPSFTSGPPTATLTATPTFTTAPPATPTSPSGLFNDTCGSAMTIDVAPYSSSILTSAATADAADPAPGCGNRSRAKSVWYRFTAPTSGLLTVNTFGSNYDTILSAYTGRCNSYTPVAGACNDDTNGAQSRISFTATGGMMYYFLVTAYSSNGGTLFFQLTFQESGPAPAATATLTPAGPTATFTPVLPTATRTQAPPPTSTIPGGFPNACSNALTVAAPYNGSLITTTATLDTAAPAPNCGNRSRAKSVWYRFTAPASGALTANTFGSNYDTILAVYSGSCGTLIPTSTCNDDTGGAQSRVSFQATAGTTYYFLVTSYANVGGTLRFALSY